MPGSFRQEGSIESPGEAVGAFLHQFKLSGKYVGKYPRRTLNF